MVLSRDWGLTDFEVIPDRRCGSNPDNPLFPASGPATGSFKSLHLQSNFLAVIHSFIHSLRGGRRVIPFNPRANDA